MFSVAATGLMKKYLLALLALVLASLYMFSYLSLSETSILAFWFLGGFAILQYLLKS